MLLSKREVKRKTTDLKQSNEDLQLQKQAAEVANLAKSQFLANMSHEIRTPMNGLLGMLQLLERTELAPKQQQYVRLAMTSSDSLMKVINDILDYSKLESGMMQLDNHTFELKKMVRDVIALFQPSVDEKGLVLSYNFDPDLPDLLKGDSFRLRQVMTNLIGNAIKFTQKGSVIIRINRIATLTKTEEAGQIRLEFLVEDTGIGISSDKLDMLFKSFSQLDTSNTRRFGGTGLGLVISKSLVERMQGEMIVRSVFGQGSLFGFTFLLEIDTDTNEKAIRTPGSFSTNKSLKSPLAGSDAFKKNAENHENVIMPSLEEGDKTDIPDKGKIIHILLAEDDLMSQKIMVQIANNNGWEITVAKDGKQAVERFGEQRFDLVLMDVQMPVLDGLAAARTLRTMESGTDRRTPIIALTAFALDGDREKCIAAGMDDYLSKPLHIERFQTLVQEWIYG